MRNMSLEEQIKLIVSFLLGLAISVLSFFAFIILSFSPQRVILWILLFFFYLAIIIFLIKWNKKTAKNKFIYPGVSAICVLAAAMIIRYDIYVHTIPSVNESEVNIYLYEPFRSLYALAKPHDEINYKILDNLPVLDGATALYPVYAAFVEAVYPEGKYDPKNSIVLCSRTTDAYNNLLDGKADIIFCAGPSEEQMRDFFNYGIKINLIPIGREAFVFFVHKENIVNGITVEDIQNIYSGKVKNWKTIGGINRTIKAYQRPDGSGSQSTLKKIMGNIPITKPRRENVEEGMGSMINRVASYRNFNNAIGYSFLHFSTAMAENDEIKLLSVNNVYPSRETIQNNSYPFCDTFYAIYAEREDMNENIKPFIEWILSKQGQEIVEKTGYVSIIDE
jgi:phosphate transport system substrate-binding protein